MKTTIEIKHELTPAELQSVIDNLTPEDIAGRFSGEGLPYEGLAKNGRWTGKVSFHEDILLKALSWKKPRKVFVNSMSDLFHEKVKDEWLDKAFAVMALTPQHTYQVLTKRPDRMLEYLNDCYSPGRIGSAAIKLRKERNITFLDAQFQTEPLGYGDPGAEWFPLPNVHLGVSVEDRANKPRIDILRQTPAAVRFLSLEPLLEDLGTLDLNGISWAIVGGESGPNARPMHPDWVRSIRDQCQAANVPFFFKQWGIWVPALEKKPESEWRIGKGKAISHIHIWDDLEVSVNLGKKKAGRFLDGRTWDEFPNTAGASTTI